MITRLNFKNQHALQLINQMSRNELYINAIRKLFKIGSNIYQIYLLFSFLCRLLRWVILNFYLPHFHGLNKWFLLNNTLVTLCTILVYGLEHINIFTLPITYKSIADKAYKILVHKIHNESLIKNSCEAHQFCEAKVRLQLRIFAYPPNLLHAINY